MKYTGRFFALVVRRNTVVFAFTVLALVATASALFTVYAVRASNIKPDMGEHGEEFEENEFALPDSGDTDYIKWMDFSLQASSLDKAYKYDLELMKTETPAGWIDLLSLAAARTWGNVKDAKKVNKEIDSAVKAIKGGKTIEELAKGYKQYEYFREAYTSVLAEFVGEYELVEKDKDGNETTTRKYGLKAFSPVVKGYSFSHYDDFGNSRSYGYKRKHLGNDILGSVGTPIVAVEGGYVEALGWNQYGGWRIGIRSYDKKRYYYYAHLRKDHPYVKTLAQGEEVKAGDIIGYLGMTGYSSKENVNNIKIPHLHFGMQIIFNEKQKDGVNQIWIDVYQIVEFLNKNRMPAHKNGKDFAPSRVINPIITD